MLLAHAGVGHAFGGSPASRLGAPPDMPTHPAAEGEEGGDASQQLRAERWRRQDSFQALRHLDVNAPVKHPIDRCWSRYR